MTYSISFMRSVIDASLSVIDVLERLSVVPKGSLRVNQTCYCPFHPNSNTKSAKVYDDPRGVTIFCFAEQHSFRSSDAFLRFSSIPLPTIFNHVWASLSKERQSYFLDSLSSSQDYISPEWRSFLSSLHPSSYSSFLESLLSFIEKESSK